MIKSIMTFAVPVFLMISGSLFLDPGKKVGIERICKRYVPRILLALFLFGVPYAVMELILQERGFSFAMIPRGFLLTISGNTWAHMWYLYELVGIYLLTPWIKVVVDYAGRRMLEYGLALGFLFYSLFPLIEQVFGIHIGIVYQLSGIYIFYYVLGYYLHRYGVWDWRYCAGLLGVMEGVIMGNGMLGWGLEIGYNSPIVVGASTFLFLLVKNLEKGNVRLSAMRNLCFGIYLVHPFFLNVFYKLFHVTPLKLGMGGIPVFWVITFVLSLIVSGIMNKIPLLKKYVL